MADRRKMYFISFEKKRRKSIQNGCLNTPLLMKIVEKQIQNEKKKIISFMVELSFSDWCKNVCRYGVFRDSRFD